LTSNAAPFLHPAGWLRRSSSLSQTHPVARNRPFSPTTLRMRAKNRRVRSPVGPWRTPRAGLLAIFASMLILRAGESVVARELKSGWEQFVWNVPAAETLAVVLPEVVLVRDSVEVETSDVRLISGKDFVVDYDHRRVVFLRQLPRGADVVIRYRRIPADWPVRQRWMRPAQPDSVARDTIGAPRTSALARRQPLPDSNLRIGGNKTFAVQVGSGRDLTLEQSLRVSINGTVAENVTVTAELSDQNLPIQPEGTTQELREIDKVLVEIKSPHYRALLGSFDARNDVGEFGRFSRRLDGAMGAASFDRWGASAGIATTRGEFRSLHLPVIDGNQGPYRLTDKNGNAGIVVIAGTERVWIDGRLLVRGEPNDYTIDYSAGELTFTRKWLLRDDMEVVVDYEYSSESYARTTTLLSAYAQDGQRRGEWQTRVFFVQEGDDTGESFGVEMDDTARAILAAAGDDPARASRPGWSYQPGGGYRLVDPNTEYFVKTTPDSGEYDVMFTRVGPGKGSYIRRQGYFEQDMVYVGQGNGDWVPRITYPLPQRTRLASLWTTYRPANNFQLECEAAMSDIDKNVLSRADDEDNTRFAGTISIETRLAPRDGRFGSINVRAKGRKVDEGFGALYRTIDPYDNRRWGLGVDESREQETTGEMAFTYNPVQSHTLDWDIGWLERNRLAERDGHTARRTGLSWRTTGDHMPAVRVTGEKIAMSISPVHGSVTSGDIYRGRAEVKTPVFHVTSSAKWEGEQDTRNSPRERLYGTRFQDWSAGLAMSETEHFAISAEVQSRYNSVYDSLFGSWVRQQRSYTQTWRGAVRSWKGLSSTAEYAWRKRQNFAGGGGTVSDNADVDIRHEALGGGVRNAFRYRVASTRTAKRERLFLYVGAGRGDYAPIDPNDTRAILAETEVVIAPAGDPAASYVLRYRDTDDFSPTVTLDAAWQMNTDFNRLWKGAANPRTNEIRPLWQRAIRVVGTETNVLINETDTARTSDLYLLKLWTFRKAGKSPTLRGSVRVTQDLLFRDPSWAGDLRFRVMAYEDYDAALYSRAGAPAVTNQKDYSVRGRLRVRPGTDWTAELKWQSDLRSGSNQDYSVRRSWLDQSITYRNSSFDEFSLRNEVGAGKDRVPAAAYVSVQGKPLEAYVVSLEPAWRKSWGNRGVMRTSAQWSGVFVQNGTPGGMLPVHLLNGRNGGHNFRASVLASYRLSSLATLSVSYSARRNAGTRLMHTARAEFNAVF